MSIFEGETKADIPFLRAQAAEARAILERCGDQDVVTRFAFGGLPERIEAEIARLEALPD